MITSPKHKKAPSKLETSINVEAKNIAELINLDDHIKFIARTPAFITLKDHKPDFRQNPSCRLINPAKNELGKVSKLIIEKVNQKLISELHFNQWKNTNSVLKWFIDISNKKDCSFIQLDIKEFYPSINKDTLTNAIQLAKLHTTIDDKDLRLIMHYRKSLLSFGNETWKKKSTESCFDVTMGSFDGAEICELVGLYIQSNLEDILPKTNFELYRDDGLILLRNLTGQQMDKKRKTIIKIFKGIGFSIDIQTNLKEVDFLDVTLNLQNGKQLSNSISERLSKNSSNQEVFNTAKVEYEDALKKSGYNVDLKYTDNKSEKPKTRKRHIIWFNPPFSKSVSINVAITFLQLVTKHIS